MAFPNSLSGRMEELRFPSLRSPDSDSFTNGATPTRGEASYFSTVPSSSDARGSLQRRFTTDSSKMSQAKPFGAQFSGMSSQSAQQKSKQQKWEEIQLMKRKAEEQLRLVAMHEHALKSNGEDAELDTISSRLGRASLSGPVSEPTTPPEYTEGGFSSNRYSRSSRLSANSVMSPPGFGNRLSQNSSQIASPAARLSGSMYTQNNRTSTKSMPVSRRGSDEEEDYAEALPSIPPPSSGNRYSMPVGSSRAQHRYSMGTTPRNGFNVPINTSFLDDTDGDYLTLNGLDLKSPIAQTFAQLQGDDTFPTLTSDGSKLSANSAAIDLANQKTPEPDWSIGSRARPGHQSMPHTDSSMYRPVLSNLSSPQGDRPSDLVRRKSQRLSLGVTFEEGAKYDQTPLPTSMPATRPTSLQTSYSTNDVPTVKKTLNLEHLTSPSKTQAEQQFHNHNISLGRIPTNGMNNRQSRELANGSTYKYDDNPSAANQSSLHASAAPFGPTYVADSGMAAFNSGQAFGFNLPAFNTNGQNGALQGLNGQSPGAFDLNNGYIAYGKGAQDIVRGGNGRRNNFDEARFNNVPLDTYRGRLYELCKDQHGCRYLQRKLEEGDADHIQAIFSETCPYIPELMIDPFGNYLCQKLFEHCNDEQRNLLIATASAALPDIALNQHGTRALQKMIEYVQTNEQTDMIIAALSGRVVDLVKDLNGNHVIQKCLTRLGAERCQFIYDAVARSCILVGTHRHGCCVLQRCIDHAKGLQRAQLIARITQAAFELVQDPFGNYVVQYILDLNEPEFTRPLCESFCGRIPDLSKQKFSSNVIEKCLRTADDSTKALLIQEMLNGNETEKMLRDSFANYVIQTALDFADPHSKMLLLETIRPLLPSIKNTAHGRRIAGKIMSLNGETSTNQGFSGNPSVGRSGGRRQIQIVGGGFNSPQYGNGFSGDVDTGLGITNGYTSMSNISGDVNESPVNMFAPQGFGIPASNGYGAPVQNGFGAPAQNGFSSFANGQMGNGFI